MKYRIILFVAAQQIRLVVVNGHSKNVQFISRTTQQHQYH